MLPSLLFGLLLSTSVQISQAVNVYLHPARPFASGLDTLDAASAAVSRHLGLEKFERLGALPNTLVVAEDFVGTGLNDGILLTINEDDVRAVLPSGFEESSTLGHIPTPDHLDSLASVVSTYLIRARQVYSSLYTPDEPWRLTDVDNLSAFFESSEGPAFAAVEVHKLQDLRRRYGTTSPEYRKFATKLRRFLEEAVYERPNFSVAIMTFQSSSPKARSPDPQGSQTPFPDHPLPQEPIGSISTCHATADTCSKGTNSCSGRGQCVEAKKSGRSCFVCACGVTTTGTGDKVKTDRWAGESCEKKDISASFVLLTGTVIVLLLVVFGSVSLLYSVGDQSLPSILLATAVNSKKD
ncbi:hypothetical protein FA15DRAFT_680334 [Coprinopsis marcescibilis]|uniref:Vacuolar sorting protein Vps3844 C-terminal domain-containing protein n=1 Tax=Coprinopsis marcescibilis TaxID=230819 RepID=A0A5C3KZD8_COPMA|nr:hypothetical protein FA15DRAFT_680334 [Coprinopsis marcescibilis]